MLATACQTATEVGERSIAPQNESSDTEPNSGTADGAAGPEPTMTTATDVFERARQSVVFLGSALEGRGSGVAIDGGWIITNAHVVGRATTVRMVTTDGVEFGDIPVRAVDPVLDIAVLGPIEPGDNGPVPIARTVSADVRVGETVFLLGYPDERNTLPVPALTQGIVNRRRNVVLRDYSFLQVDALIAPGQSGGALVDSEGRLIGLSGLLFGAAQFGLALEADSLDERVQLLLDKPEPADPFDGEPVTSFEDVLGPRRYVAFMTETDGPIDVEVTSTGDMFIELRTASGWTIFKDWQNWDYFVDLPRVGADYQVDRTLQGTERLEVTVDPGRYQVLIGSAGRGPAMASIVSGVPLFPLPDLEEGAILTAGEVHEGEIDWTRDSDKWNVPLLAGDKATITIDGIGDYFGVVRLNGQVVASNDDAGFGVFALGTTIEFTAEGDSDYELEIGTRDADWHGYFVKLDIE